MNVHVNAMSTNVLENKYLINMLADVDVHLNLNHVENIRGECMSEKCFEFR